MYEDEKETLKKWGIIKNNTHLQIYYDIRPLMMRDKIQQYGSSFVDDLIKIIELKEEKAILRFIKRTRSKLNQLIIADTFLALRKGFQFFTNDCKHRLLELCTVKNENCSILICPEIKEKLKKESLNLFF